MDLIGKEIFAIGKWNGIEFTDTDLDDIVANFDALGDVQKVPLKLGHNDKQPVTDGQPALGWVKRIYREGKKLLADFVDMPTTIHEAVLKKLYRTVSVELLFDVDHKGNKFNHVLDAVALLGADQPAVNTLKDLDALLASRKSAFTFGRRVVFETVAGKGKSEPKETDMDKKEIQELIAASLKPLEDTVSDLTAKNKDLETENAALKASREKSDNERKAEKVTLARTDVNKVLDDAVKAKQLTPAIRETYAKQIGVDDDEKVVAIDIESVKTICSATKNADDEETGLDDKNPDRKEKNPGDELTRLTRKDMATSGVKSFVEQFMRTCEANPELHTEYLDSNGEA